ncbi:DotU family type IV/VI secretion system protein [Trinickia dinghuensis]|uniref:DotU family type IV/VI secretion system protein n=1 Tax=Trinickia dinghuensis TaxID=2291023 RepID=A0A3D8JQM0_9BURK|nr:DotU family type IV/VI secretion system protein [Trinickia dinghuensis]RDU94731.1 DotU family type IV/VI secretion system protein [Trinickia dinghuensis]
MREAPTWLAPPPGNLELVARFADFYQEVAALKRAQADGWLAAYLAGENAPQPTTSAEFAQRASARLLGALRQQERRCTAQAGSEAGQLERTALYLMAALADEILIFELDWPGREAWLGVLLEQSMFGSSNAGSRFFSKAEQLVRDNLHAPLRIDLASVFLLALELGFKGCYRARQAQPQLDKIRSQLYQLVSASGRHVYDDEPAFAQAYAYPLTGRRDERLAPISPWRNLGLYGLIAYLALTTVAWIVLMHPFARYLNS